MVGAPDEITFFRYGNDLAGEQHVSTVEGFARMIPAVSTSFRPHNFLMNGVITLIRSIVPSVGSETKLVVGCLGLFVGSQYLALRLERVDDSSDEATHFTHCAQP